MKDLLERRIPLLLFFLVLFSYVNSLSGEFVWDDHVQIAENQFIRKINNIPMLFTIGNDATFHQEIFTVNYYRPLQVLTYIFDYHIWGLKPFGFHLTNILLHYFNSFFVFILIYLITNKKLPAFLVSILFAVHPVNTSSVSYISGRADLIAMFFILLTFIFWIKGITINTSYLLSIFFFSLSLLAKEIAVVLPFLLLFYAYIEFSKNKGLLRKIFVKITPFFALIFIYFLIRKFILENIKLQSVNLHFFPLLSTLCKIFCLYLKMLVFPNNLYIGHDTLISTATIFPFIFLFIAFAFLPIMLIFINHNFVRKILFFTAWFIAFLLPQLFPMHADYSRRVLMAEHWIYVSSVALYFIIANIVVFFITRIKQESFLYKKFKLSASISLVILIFTYVIITINQNNKWENDLIIGEHTLKNSYVYRFYNWKVCNNLGKVNEDLERYPEARKLYEQALQIALLEGNKYITAKMYYSIANVDCFERNYSTAISNYKKAIELYPLGDSFFAGLGYTYIMLNDRTNAEWALRRALEINPTNQNAKHNLSIMLKQ